MLCVFTYCSKDRHLAVQLAEWIRDLGGVKEHTCLMLYPKEVGSDGIREPLADAFQKVGLYQLTDPEASWPAGPNLAFRRAAVQIEATLKVPWLFLEVDAVPLTPTWLDQIEAEYKAKCVPCAKMPDRTIRPKGGRAILGVRVDYVEGVIPHCSGVAVYAGNIPSLAPLLIRSNAVAFDVNASRETLPLLAETKLIVHEWRPEQTTENMTKLAARAAMAGAVLLHQDKAGLTISELRRRFAAAEGITDITDPRYWLPGSPGNETDRTVEEHAERRYCRKCGYTQEPGVASSSRCPDCGEGLYISDVRPPYTEEQLRQKGPEWETNRRFREGQRHTEAAVKIVHGGVALVPSLSEAERITGADKTLTSEAVEVPLPALPKIEPAVIAGREMPVDTLAACLRCEPKQQTHFLCSLLRDLASVSSEQSKMVRRLIVDHGLGELKVFPRKARNNRVKPKKGPKAKVDLAAFATGKGAAK